MNWLDSNHIDYIGKSYHKTWSDIFPGNKDETIMIDSVDSRIAEIIRTSFDEHLGKYLKKDLSGLTNSYNTLVLRNEIARAAFECSNELRERLPFLGFENSHKLLENKEDLTRMMREVYPETTLCDDKMVWTYYLKQIDGGKKLSELTGTGFIDCVGQALAIKMSLGKDYGMNGFALYNQRPKEHHVNPDGTITSTVHVHAMVALRLSDDYFLRIDPIHDRGMNPDSFLNYRQGFWNSFVESDIRDRDHK